MHRVKKLLVFTLTLLLLLNMTNIPYVFATDRKNEMTASEEAGKQGEAVYDQTEDTTPVTTEDTVPVTTGEKGTSQEPVIATVTGSAVDELNTPVNDLEIHLVAVEGQELPESNWAKIDLSTESSEFHFELPANVEYRMTITAKAKAYDDYTTTLTVEEDTDLGKLVLPFATMNLTFFLTNAKATCMYTNGTNVYNVSTDDQNPVSVRYGTAVTVRFAPADGCELPNIASVNGEEVVLSNNGFDIPACEDDLEIKLAAKDVTAPEITNIAIADPDAWTQSKIVTFTVADNSYSATELQLYVSKELYATANQIQESATLLPDHQYVVTENSTFYVYAIDPEGNMSRKSYEITKIDRTAPVISDLTADENGWTTKVTYSFHAEDNAELSRVYWVSALGIEHDLDLTEDGNYEFAVHINGNIQIIAVDTAGNRTTTSTTVENIDNDPPAITDIVVQTKWDASENLVMFAVTDNVGIDSVAIINEADEKEILTLDECESTYRYYATANGTYTIKAVDAVGNETTATFTVNHIDTASPIITSITKTPAQEWTNSSIQIRIDTEETQSGIKSLRYRFKSDNEDAWTEITATEGQTEFTFTIPNSSNLFDYCQIVTVDNVGRVSDVTEIYFQIDVDAPVISALTPNTETGAHKITYNFTVTDNGALASVTWTLNGEQQLFELTEDGAYSVTVTENGTLTITATDKAGNTTTKNITVGNIDWTPPTITAYPQQTWDAAVNAVRIYVTDAFGVATVEVVDGEGTVHQVVADGDSYIFTTTQNGSYTVRAVDDAGNEATLPFVVDHIDKNAPVITSATKDPASEWTAEMVTITVNASDEESGIKALHYRFASAEDNNWHEVMAAAGQTVFTITIPNDKDWRDVCQIVIEDNVGRKSTVSTMEFAVDATAPINFVFEMERGEDSGFFTTLTNLFAYGLLYRDYITFHAFADDPSSGVDYYEYQFVEKDQTPLDNGWTRMTMKEENGNVSAKAVVKADDFAGYLHIRVYDKCGNMMEYATNQDNSDSFIVVLENTPKTDNERAEAPALTSKTSDGAAYEAGVWTSQSVTVSAKAEGAISGVKRYEVQIVPTGSTYTENAWQEAPGGKVTISTDSNVEVYFRAVSYAENASRISSTTVRVQKTAPQNAVVTINGTRGLNAWYITTPQIVITEPTPAPTHAKIKTWFNLHAVGTAGEDLLYGANKPVIHGDGVYELAVWTVDEAGNVSGKIRQIISVDTTAPTELDITVDGISVLAGNQSTAVYKHIYGRAITVRNSSNCNVSGQLSVSYQKVYNMSQYDANGSWAAWPQNGLHIVPDENCVIYLRVIDNAGNTTIVHSDGIVLDKTAPSDIALSTIGANGYGYYAGDGTVDVKVSDPDVNGAYVGLRSISYEVIRDGVVTQSETIRVGENGVNIRQTDLQRGNNGVVSYWNGRINILAAENNSDNIIVRVTATDNVGNARTSSTTPGAVRIDTTAPTAVMFYNNNRADSSYGTAHFDADRTLTIKVTERDFAAGLAELLITRNGVAETASLNWVKTAGKLENGDDNVYTASITLHEDGEYKVSLKIRDYAGNEASSIRFTDGTVAGNTFVIDQTAPKIEVSYDNNDVKNEHYFDAARTMTITVTDASFAPDRFTFQITAEKDGQAVTVPTLSGWTHDGEKHTASIRFTEDGDYTFTCAVVDKAGNKSKNASYGVSKAPTAFTIDTTPVAVSVDGLTTNTAYSGELKPTVTFHDINFDGYTIKLKVTNMDTADVDVTKEFVKPEKDGVITMEFPEDKNVDGIYVLEYEFYDKAAHKTSATYKFTVNRNGSVFEYSEDLLALLNNYVYNANGVYSITEYNPGQVETRTITITRDGAPVADPQWNMENQDGSESKWHKYEYTILPQNFNEDGRYRITIASDDNAKNRTEATPDILFWIDKTAPELPLITGLEDDIVNANELNIKVQAYDTIGLAKILIELTDNDGVTKVLLEEEFEEGETGAERSVVIGEGLRQHLRVVVTDRAGNTIDTDSGNFAPAYTFEKKVTVSENLLTRWYADPWMFYGSIGGFAALIAIIIVLLASAKKRKKAKK